MIPRLYEHNETSFASFGIGVLKDTTSCEVTEERNGKYELVLKYPLNGQLYSEIQKERIIYAQVNDNKSLQAFRIYRITAPMSGIITVYAQHISYDLSGVVAFPCSFDNANPNQILTFISQRRLDRAISFTFSSDIATTGAFKVESPRTVRSVIGGDNSLISTFGGEVEWNNFNVSLKASRGSDNGVSILYGKNLTKLEHNSDLSGVYTHLCPYAKVKDGDTEIYQELTEKVLPIVTTLSEKKVLIKDFSSSFGTGEDDLELTEANLRQVANDYLAENILGIESPNITLSFEELRNQLGYQNLQETVKLCDIVTVKYAELGVNVKTKIVKVVYDTLKEKYKSLTLGAIQTSLEDRIVSLEKGVEDNEKEILEVPSHIKVAVDEATAKITGANGGCVVLNLDNQERPYEFLIMDDYDIQDATKVWRWNINGLGYSPNGYNGPYTTAITYDGHIVADFIDTGTLNADIIKAGTIEALSGDSYWDLETGDISLTGTIYATAGEFDNVTINDTCSFYGYLYMEGSESVPIYGNRSQVRYETRVGGEGIDSYVYVQPRNDPDEHVSYSVIRPYGIITVPDNYYNYANDHMMFGVTERFSYKEQNLLAGMYFAYTHLSENEFNSFMQLKCGDKDCFKAELYTDGNGWTQKTTVGINAGTTNINGEYVTFMNSDGGWMETYYYQDPDGDYYICPLLVGNWFSNATLQFGTDLSSYRTRIDNDQLTFFYGSTQVGDIEAYTSYVDIQGTWKTNGSNWISTSDIKVKNTIEELDERYSVLFNLLKPRSYKFNEGKSNRKHTGFIVQEVLEAMEEARIPNDEYGLCVAFGDKENPETIWGLRYEEIIALCVKEIQSLRKEVKQLKEEKK